MIIIIFRASLILSTIESFSTELCALEFEKFHYLQFPLIYFAEVVYSEIKLDIKIIKITTSQVRLRVRLSNF